MAASRPPFPFIVACGRSGTTLVQAMLNAHPEMAIPPEAHFLVPVGRGVPVRDGRIDIEQVASRWERHPYFALWELPPDRLREALSRAKPATYPDAARTLYALYAEGRGKARYGDKTPKHVLNLPYLADAFPEARFIHLLRDGRDVTCSFIARRIGPRDAVEGAIRWKRTVARGRRDGARLPRGRYLEVRYEDFVADPEGNLRRICELIDLPWDGSMLEYREGLDRMLPEGHLRDLHENVYRPPTEGLRDWRREMMPEEVAVFEALAGDLLSELGYERTVSRPSPSLRLEARRRWALVKADRARRKALRVAGWAGAGGSTGED
jgi:hypothetical protein